MNGVRCGLGSAATQSPLKIQDSTCPKGKGECKPRAGRSPQGNSRAVSLVRNCQIFHVDVSSHPVSRVPPGLHVLAPEGNCLVILSPSTSPCCTGIVACNLLGHQCLRNRMLHLACSSPSTGPDDYNESGQSTVGACDLRESHRRLNSFALIGPVHGQVAKLLSKAASMVQNLDENLACHTKIESNFPSEDLPPSLPTHQFGHRPIMHR
jgi:hypothetical protein